MKPPVVLVVLCVLAASILVLAAGAADHQLRAGGESVVGIDSGDDRTTPPGTETQAGETPTPTTSPTTGPSDDGSTDGSTGTSGGDPAVGGSDDPTSTPTASPTTDGRAESTPSATATESGTVEPTPGDGTATETDGETATVTDPAPDERAGLSLPGLGTGLWVVFGITVVLVLAIVAARRR